MTPGREAIDRLVRLAREQLGLNLRRGAMTTALEEYAAIHGEVLGEPELESEAFQRFVDVVTVQHSWLFRDAEQLETACRLLGPSSEPRHVWVPACATGEDVYSILALAEAQGLDVRALGTDIHAGAVERSHRAWYREGALRHVPAEHRHILEGRGPARTIHPMLRRRATFQVRNMLLPAPRSPRADGSWDLIVCRNALIYFSKEHALRALAHLRDALAPEGTLVLGASDILTELPPGLDALEADGRMVFRRSASAPMLEARTPSPTTIDLGTLATERASKEDAEKDEPADNDRLGVERLLVGLKLQRQGELERASAELRAALCLCPTLWPASYSLALVLETLGRQEEAERAYAVTRRNLACPVPVDVPGHDFSFLRGDVADIVRRRSKPSA